MKEGDKQFWSWAAFVMANYAAGLAIPSMYVGVFAPIVFLSICGLVLNWNAWGGRPRLPFGIE